MRAGLTYERSPGWVWRSWSGSVLAMGPDVEPVQLDGAAAVVWLALDAPATIEGLTAPSGVLGAADRWAGAPGDPFVLAEEAVDALVELGAVVPADSALDHPAPTVGASPRSVGATGQAGPPRVETVDGILPAAAVWGLRPSDRSDGAAVVAAPGDVDGAALVARSVEERVVGLLAAAARAGAIDLPDDVLAQVDEAHRHALIWCLRIEIQLLHLDELLRASGIVPVVLKGPATAHLDAADPSLRTFADLDLLVRAEDLDRTVALIEADGGRRRWAERRPGYDRRFAKSVTMVGPDGMEIDLHRSLCDGVHGFRIPLDDLHDSAAELELGGGRLRCLAREHRVLHTAYHLTLGSERPRLMSERDLVEHLVDPATVLDEVVSEARRWRGEAVLATAVRQALADLDVSVPAWAAWAASTPGDGPEQAIVDRQRVEGSSLGRAKFAAIGELPSWRDRAALALAIALPTRAHLQSRGRTRLGRWRRR